MAMMPPDLAAMLDNLPAALPEDYRQFLEMAAPVPASEHFRSLVPAEAEWQTVVTGFLREWHPLGGRLFPVEHLGEGIFACLALGQPDSGIPVVSWDIAVDLGEQPFLELAASWAEYRDLRERGEDPLSWLLLQGRRQAALAARELQQSLDRFDQAVQSFHDQYANRHAGQIFEHHTQNARLKDRDWKPERFAVQDHLLGVMAYRFNAADNAIDVVGFATRDHTHFARGSATAGLTLGLLCEWAVRGADTLRFLSNTGKGGKPLPAPREIALLGRLLGADIHFGQHEITTAQAATLLQALTPFPAAIRRALGNRLRQGAERACLAVHREIWSPWAAALLIAWCPQAAELFGGAVDPGEQVRYQALLYHARAAVLAGFGVEKLMATAETLHQPTPPAELLLGFPTLAYSVWCQPAFATIWRRAGGGEVEVAADQPLVLAGIPDPAALTPEAAQTWLARLREQAPRRGAPPSILGVVPDRSIVPHGIPDLTLVTAHQDRDALDEDLRKRLLKSRRIRL